MAETIAVEFLKLRESWRSMPYQDIGGKWTIGWGHLILSTTTGKPAGRVEVMRRYGDGITQEYGTVLLNGDLREARMAVKLYVRVPLTPHQEATLISFVYNVGITQFKTSTLLKLLNRGMYTSVPSELRRFVYCERKFSQGLANRREYEVALWNT